MGQAGVANSGGTVRAVVTLGNNGKAATVGIPDSDKNLGEEVRDALIGGTSYLESSTGKVIEFLFTFRSRDRRLSTR